jgi:hypothetical protein
VIANSGLEAKHEVVKLVGHPTLRSPLTWNDFTRRGSWSEAGRRSTVWRAPKAGFESGLGHTNTDVWIGAHGEVWWGAFPSVLGFGKHEGSKTCHYVLSRGDRLRLKRGYDTYQNFHTVPGGVLVMRSTPKPQVYAHVIEVALKNLA